jgi:hypothetical protein
MNSSADRDTDISRELSSFSWRDIHCISHCSQMREGWLIVRPWPRVTGRKPSLAVRRWLGAFDSEFSDEHLGFANDQRRTTNDALGV